MPRTIESIVENHRVASERRQAGLPVWDRRIELKPLLDSKCDDADAVRRIAGEFAERIKRQAPAGWLDEDSGDFDEDLDNVVFNLVNIHSNEEIDDIDEAEDDFNAVMDELYDWADRKRVWIE